MLDHLRSGIGLRAYGQRDPLNEYKREAFNLFESMLNRLREAVTRLLAHIELRMEQPQTALAPAPPREIHEQHANPLTGENEMAEEEAMAAAGGGMRHQPAARARPAVNPNDPGTWGKVARNTPCPCGSGRKYKHCHGRS